MVVFLLAASLLSAGPSLWSYRTPDGIEHYVESEVDVPAPFRRAARPVDLSGVSLNRNLEKGFENAAHEAARAAQMRADAEDAKRLPAGTWAMLRLLPGRVPLAAGGIAFALVALLLGRLLRRSPSRAWLGRVARVAGWVTAACVLLLVVRLALPHAPAWERSLSRLSFRALRARQDENADVMDRNIAKARMRALGLDSGGAGSRARKPAAPFWSGSQPPAGLLRP